ncbi:hypothetical protein QFZ40_003021 [Arthrobacter pascens]|nr:hypothetical protein [Arthrobacter pascens]
MRVFLLSDSCTTGWLHWGHGELWLTPTHLVRIGRRELTMRAAGWGGTRRGAAVAAVNELAGSIAAVRPVPGAAIEVDAEHWERELAAEPSPNAYSKPVLAEALGSRLALH